MTEPWFSIETARWFPFICLLAFLSGLELFAKRGVHRRPVMAIGIASIVLGLALFVAGIIAYSSGQPRFVTQPLLLAGFVVGIVCTGGLFQLRKHYADAELRKVAAADL